MVTLASLLIQAIHTPYALPRLSCTVAATAATLTMWSCHLKECFVLASAVKGRCVLNFVQLSALGYAMLMSPNKDKTAVHGCHWPYRRVMLCDHCFQMVYYDIQCLGQRDQKSCPAVHPRIGQRREPPPSPPPPPPPWDFNPFQKGGFFKNSCSFWL